MLGASVSVAFANPQRKTFEHGLVTIVDDLSGRDVIRRMFKRAAAARMTVVRTWAHGFDEQFPFSVCTSQLHYVLSER